MAKHEFRVYQGVPLTRLIAPYIVIVISHAKATLNSGYRGGDAEKILNKHHHMSQPQLFRLWQERAPGANPANPPGFSTHELKSDGAAYTHIPRGHDLEWWMLGFDVNDSDVERVEAAAGAHGWVLFRPYSSGSEFHHLNFKYQPKPRLRDRAQIIRLRSTLPRS